MRTSWMRMFRRAWAFSERGLSLRVGLLTGQELYTYVAKLRIRFAPVPIFMLPSVRACGVFQLQPSPCQDYSICFSSNLPKLRYVRTRFVPVRIFPNYPICSSPKVSKLRTYSICPSSNLPKLRTYVFDLCVRAYVRDCEHVRWRSPERVWWPHRHTMFRLRSHPSFIRR